MLGTQLLTCALMAARGSCTSRCIYRAQNTAQCLGHCPAQDFRAGTGYPFEWIQIPKFSSLGFFMFCFIFQTLRSLRVTGAFIFFFSFSSPPLQFSLLLQATGPGYIIVLVTVALSHLLGTTGILEVNAAALAGAHSQDLQAGSKAGGGVLLCLPLAECQNPSRCPCLRTPGRSSHT